MQYALLIYDTPDIPDAPDPAARPVDGAVTAAAVLADGPFVDSKEFLAGLILIEADDLDGALAVAQEMLETRTGGAIEVRPVRAGHPRGA
jgi:hypothetical protein